MARECGGFRVKRCKTGQKSPGFWPRKPVAKRFYGFDLSDIPLTHRRDRIEVSAGIANDEDEKSDTRLRALRQIARRDGG